MLFYKNQFAYSISECISLSSESIVYKGTQYNKNTNSTVKCILKFKLRKNFTDIQKITDISERLKDCNYMARVIDVIDDLKDFYREEPDSICINNENYFCIAEEFIEGKTLTEYCLNFKNIGFIRENGDFYPQCDDDVKKRCRDSLTPKFYLEYQNQICSIMIQLCSIFDFLKEKNILYKNIKADNIIINNNSEVFIVNPLNAEYIKFNQDLIKSSISSLGKIFRLCLNIFDLLMDSENGTKNLNAIIKNTFSFDSSKNLVPKSCHYNSDICKILKKCSKNSYYSFTNLKYDIQTAEKSQKSRKSKIIFLSVFLLILVSAGALFIISENKNKSVPDSELTDEIPQETINIEDAENQAQDIFNQLTSGDISEEDALKVLYTLYDKTNSDKIHKIIFKVNDRINFNLGEEDFNAGNYMQAVEDYRKVSNTDKMIFENARSKISMCIENYQKEEKQKIQDLIINGENYQTALENIKSLADEFPDDTAFADECDELYSDILREWINSQKSNENYFGDNGAVIIAYTYQFFDFEGGIDELKQEGFQCETKKLFDMINSHREQNGLPALEINSSMMDTAQLCADNYLQGESPNVEYNTDIIDRNTAEEIMQYHYTDKVHTSPFLESSTNIGIGISFNTENMKCAWIILT